MKYLTNFAGQNWLITPAALAVGEIPSTLPAHPVAEALPARIHDQKWLLVLSGVVVADLEGNSGAAWLRETLSFEPDMSGPLNWAISHFSIPKPPGPPGSYIPVFSVEEWAPFAALSSIFNRDHSINSGFSVDMWRPNHFSSGVNILTHEPVNNIFTGLNVDAAVRDTDAWIYRVSYYITLLGKIVFTEAPTIG